MAIHNFKVGDKVTVLITTAQGTVYIDGQATIVKTCGDGEDSYLVRFDGERTLVKRYVDPNAQENPQEYAAELTARMGR